MEEMATQVRWYASPGWIVGHTKTISESSSQWEAHTV